MLNNRNNVIVAESAINVIFAESAILEAFGCSAGIVIPKKESEEKDILFINTEDVFKIKKESFVFPLTNKNRFSKILVNDNTCNEKPPVGRTKEQHTLILNLNKKDYR
jgi:hypothetical protein